MHCDDGFRELICGRLAEFSVQGAEVAGARAAAVAVTIVDAGLGAGCNGLPAHDDWQGGAALLLTRPSTDGFANAPRPTLEWPGRAAASDDQGSAPCAES